MADPNAIERDLREYLEKEKNLHRQDKLEYLRKLFAKHFALDELSFLVTKNDLFHIMSSAKSEYTKLSLPLFISGRAVDSSELSSVAMIEALVSFLNKNHLLNRRPVVDYTDVSGEYDALED